MKRINTERRQTKCAVVLLTGLFSAGFTVPFVSLLDALNFMPSAVKRKGGEKKHSRKINLTRLLDND